MPSWIAGTPTDGCQVTAEKVKVSTVDAMVRLLPNLNLEQRHAVGCDSKESVRDWVVCGGVISFDCVL
jgi:hypothetical protein